MRSSLIIYFCLLFCSATCFAQILKGTVVDAETKEPITGANVYLNGTTLGDMSGLSGIYIIKVPNIIYTQLIASYMGYESVIIEKPFDYLPDTIFLKEKNFDLNEVTVKGKATFSEKQKMKAFREQFLGTSTTSRGCKILNEKDIRIVYDPETNELQAYSDVPIVIDNKYLGYKILWELIDFTLVLNDRKSLAPRNIETVSIIGAASFEDTGRNNITFFRRREDAYRYSKNIFFSSLSNKKLKNKDIYIFNNTPNLEDLANEEPTEYSEWFSIEQEEDSNTKKLIVNPKKTDSTGIAGFIVVFAKRYGGQTNLNHPLSTLNSAQLKVVISSQTYNTASLSRVFISTDKFNVDVYGNTDMVKELFVTGDFGVSRISDQLPLDYISLPQPSQKNKKK